ncbi:MAG: hypothetical protein ABWY66_00005, partial [Xanthobacteraceae bacterium]
EESLMIKTTVGIVSVAAAVLLAASFANVSAQTKQSDKQSPACTELKEEFACKGRSDCRWAEASGKKKAGCAKGAKKK